MGTIKLNQQEQLAAVNSAEGANISAVQTLSDTGEIKNTNGVSLPVTVAPQIVLYYGEQFKYSSEYYASYNSENEITEGVLNIYEEESGYTSDTVYVEIYKNNLAIDGHIKKVELCLSAQSGAYGYFKFNGEIIALEEKDYKFDITEIYNNSGNYVQFSIYGDVRTYHNKSSSATFYNSGDKAAKLIITYMENAERYSDDNLPNKKTFELADKLNLHLDLNNGDINAEIADMAIDGKLPFTIGHVYKTGRENQGFGKCWGLNLTNAALVKSWEDTITDTKFLYIDSLGDYYDLNEKFYYYDGNRNKVFVDKDKVCISPDGELYYGEYKINVHQSCGGNMLIAEIEDYVGSDLIEQRQNEQIQLEETVKSYEQTLGKLVVFDLYNSECKGKIIKRISGLEKADFTRLQEEAAKSSNYYIASESEALQIQSLIFNAEQTSSQYTQTLLRVIEYEKIMQNIKTKNPNNYESDADYLNAAINKDAADKESKALSKQSTLASEQKEYYLRQIKDNSEKIAQTFDDYLKKKTELEIYLRRLPRNYLRDENGIIRGFNSEGKLVCMFDAYGTTVGIDYNVNGQIIRINEDDVPVATFNYVDGLLDSVADNRGRNVRYEYEAGKLTKIIYPDGETLEIKYSSNRLASVTSSEGLQWKLSYSYQGKIVRMLEKRLAPVSATVSDTAVSYADTTTEITYDDGNSEKYTFDAYNKLIAYRKTDAAKFKTDTSYAYETNDTGKKVTITTCADPNYSRGKVSEEQYDQLGKLISKTEGWVNLSDAVKVKTDTTYEYDLNGNLINETAVTYTDENGAVKETKSVTKYSYNAQGKQVLTESYTEGEEETCGKNYEERVYNEGGNVIQCIRWNSLDSSSKFYEESEISEKGQVIADRGETGEVSAEYEYEANSNTVKTVKYTNGSKMSYGRDPNSDRVTSVTQSTNDGEANQTDILYRYGQPVKVTGGNTVIDYAYDGKDRKTSVKINGVLQSTYSYEDFKQISPDDVRLEKVSKVLNIDGGTVKSVYLREGSLDADEYRIVKEESLTVGNKTQYKKRYNNRGYLAETTNNSATEEKITYEYDGYDNLTKAETTANGVTSMTENYTYNGYGELTQKATRGAVTQTYTYAYKTNAARGLDYITFGGYKFKPLSDVNGRNTGKEIYNGSNKLAAEYITYRKVGDHATNMPATVWFGNGSNIKDSIKYKYDTCGNICQITQNGHVVAKYTYDSLNRLIREDNKLINKTSVYSYDNNGNIVERCEYDYTSKTGEELSEQTCTHYSYDYDGDKLTNYNGESFAYNSFGNPTTYRNKAVTWQYGRYLAQLGNTTFAYDGLGRRIKKNNITFTYDNDGRLIKQSNGLEFVYDDKGVVGVKYTNNMYFYRKDAQGNVIAILDGNGGVVVKYFYDAWGNHAVVDNNGKDITSGIGVLNPFRYRGYYYDTETELYYLQTRYYDPEIGRFISRDSIEYADPETINGLNLYAYCGNNPTNYLDPTGNAEWWQWLLGIVIIVASVALSVVTAGIATPISAALGGGMLGAVVGGAVAGAVGGAIASFGISVATQGISNGFDNINWGQVGWATLGGAVTGAILGGIGGGLKYAKAASYLKSNGISDVKGTLKNFKGIPSVKTSKGITAYRYYDNIGAFQKGRYLTNSLTNNPIKDLVLYKNEATFVSKFIINDGTKYLVGRIAGSSSNLLQYYVANINWLTLL